eukprot:6692400-Lingulodinium_polyedra.AAC.1
MWSAIGSSRSLEVVVRRRACQSRRLLAGGGGRLGCWHVRQLRWGDQGRPPGHVAGSVGIL